MDQPLILVTNDDGIDSSGLWAVVEAVLPLGEVLVVAPDRQWSGGGRSMPHDVSGRIREAHREVDGRWVTAYAVDASPALAIDHGVVELAPRRPTLVVSGVNFGANLGIEVTISGTVGAALEASAFGIPAMAVSLEMGAEHHLSGDEGADYAASKAFAQQFAEYLLYYDLPHDVDVLNINIPSGATPRTPWRLTRLSRHRYFLPTAPDRENGEGRPGYKLLEEIDRSEVDSDVRAIMLDEVVSVTPISLDLTSRVSFSAADQSLPVEHRVRVADLFSLPTRLEVGDWEHFPVSFGEDGANEGLWEQLNLTLTNC
jgi:5'-nucleotidase